VTSARERWPRVMERSRSRDPAQSRSWRVLSESAGHQERREVGPDGLRRRLCRGEVLASPDSVVAANAARKSAPPGRRQRR
jgi:hypothetical protein